jgi:hypothetical protein
MESVLRKRLYVLESRNELSKLPPNTDIVDARGFTFSKWDGKLALVTTGSWTDYVTPEEFRPDKMLQRYHVRYAIDPYTKKPFQADNRNLGRDVRVANPSVPYDKTFFKVGDSFSGVSGGFDSGQEIWVKVPFKKLNRGQERALLKFVQDRKYWESYHPWGHAKKISAAKWLKALRGRYSDVIETADDNIVEALVKMIENNAHVKGYATDSEFDRAWREVPGIYALKNNGELKFIVDREKGVWK